jgi:hypothetical protein
VRSLTGSPQKAEKVEGLEGLGVGFSSSLFKGQCGRVKTTDGPWVILELLFWLITH